MIGKGNGRANTADTLKVDQPSRRDEEGRSDRSSLNHTLDWTTDRATRRLITFLRNKNRLLISLPDHSHAASSLTITSCSFTSFTSSTSPSILSSTIQPIQSVTLSDTSFVSCHSSVSARSGVLDVSLIEGITITFTHSCETFTSCSSPKATANLIFISHPSLSVSVISSSLDLDSTKTSDSLADLAVKE
ncbi:hypothetical protein BLNAU_22938 [Blattamonas nauphoetae]|uniref:Uncharacterized protein n=1 Tax=Blattamonas nauphoetae TaxID=2049346 RepID=A0ABQ9WRM5_9EUKA|nr:hypothetical protein BLNAU_22938 [Blattamonas nauphoetae]